MKVVKQLKKDLPNKFFIHNKEFIHNKSIGNDCTSQDRENTNGHLYPDIRFDLPTYQLIIEIDENKHRGGNLRSQ